MRRALQDGQIPRFLQENATNRSRPQAPQCTRAKPCARIPQRRFGLRIAAPGGALFIAGAREHALRRLRVPP
jgi:hypothetical protein